jgi:hypothetical protein
MLPHRVVNPIGNLNFQRRHSSYCRKRVMPILTNPRHEAFAQALARGEPAVKAYVEAGYKENRHNAATLARKQHILTRVGELQEEQLTIHQQATAEIQLPTSASSVLLRMPR